MNEPTHYKIAIRMVTKSGESLYLRFEEDPSHPFNFDSYYFDRIAHEHGMFPYDSIEGQGRISVDCLARIDWDREVGF